MILGSSSWFIVCGLLTPISRVDCLWPAVGAAMSWMLSPARTSPLSSDTNEKKHTKKSCSSSCFSLSPSSLLFSLPLFPLFLFPPRPPLLHALFSSRAANGLSDWFPGGSKELKRRYENKWPQIGALLTKPNPQKCINKLASTKLASTKLHQLHQQNCINKLENPDTCCARARREHEARDESTRRLDV